MENSALGSESMTMDYCHGEMSYERMANLEDGKVAMGDAGNGNSREGMEKRRWQRQES